MPIANAFRESLRSDKPVFEPRASYAPALIEVYGQLNLNFVRSDLEHPGPSHCNSEYFEALAKTPSLADAELLVGLPEADPTTIRRVIGAVVRFLPTPRCDRGGYQIVRIGGELASAQ